MSSAESQIGLLLFLLVLFTIKHWLGDFIIQANFQYMMRKGNKSGWALPLLVHSLSHGALTFLILIAPVSFGVALTLALLDTCVHGVVDYWKAQVHSAPFNSKGFWVGFGLDQMLHHLTYLGLAYMAIHFM